METGAQGAAGCLTCAYYGLGIFPYLGQAGSWQMKFRCPLQAGLATAPAPTPAAPWLQEGKFCLISSFWNQSFKAKRGFLSHPISFSKSPCKPLEGRRAWGISGSVTWVPLAGHKMILGMLHFSSYIVF